MITNKSFVSFNHIKIKQSTTSWCRFIEHQVISICQFMEMLWQNLKTTLTCKENKLNSFRSITWSLKHLLTKQLWMQKYWNLELRPYGELGKHIYCLNILHSSSKYNTFDYLIFPKLVVEAYKIASSPISFTWWYLTSMKMLKGTQGV